MKTNICDESRNPVNYRPGIRPRSQDMLPVLEETTGLYGIKREALRKYHCRIGRKPYIHIVSKFEAVDIILANEILFRFGRFHRGICG